MSRTSAAIAKSAANRTRRKWERRADELRAAGYSVVEAGHIMVIASGQVSGPTLLVWCERCRVSFAEWTAALDVEVPLPAVLHGVNSHVCEEKP